MGINAGYWTGTYWPRDYWPDDYWPVYGAVGAPMDIRGKIASWLRATIEGIVYNSQYSGVDASTESLTTIPYVHHEAHAGTRYYTKYWLDVATDNVIDIRLVTPNTAKLSHLIYSLEFEGEFNFWLYKTVTKETAGTALTPTNRRHGGASSGTVIDYIVNTSIANANADTDISGASELARGKGGSGKKIGGTIGDRDEDILETNEIYSIRVENDAAGTLWFDWNIDFYEHADKN